MKKTAIYLTTISMAALLITAGVISGATINADAVNSGATAQTLTVAAAPKLDSGNETVYAITNASGENAKLFVGNTIYTGNETLPFGMHVTYYLDDVEITPEHVAGKSGHVKIVYEYDSKTSYYDKKVPFLAVTGLTFDNAKFSNVRTENGKIISSGNSTIVLGYAVLGVNENFDTEILPESFTVEADVNNFALGNTYTLVSNDAFRGLDTSKLATIDGVRTSVNELGAGLNQLIDGSTELSDGLGEALAGSRELYEGSKVLAAGIETAAEGADKLSNGLSLISSNNDALQAGANTVIMSTTAQLAEKGIDVNVDDYDEILSTRIQNMTTQYQNMIASGVPAEALMELHDGITTLSQAKGLLDLATGIINYTNGVASVGAGAENLSIGLNQINAKTPELVAGLGKLVDGNTKLYEGSVKLNEGLGTMKSSGIDRLVDFANRDLANFTYNARKTVNAADSYHGFDSDTAESVKFIVKTASI